MAERTCYIRRHQRKHKQDGQQEIAHYKLVYSNLSVTFILLSQFTSKMEILKKTVKTPGKGEPITLHDGDKVIELIKKCGSHPF